MQTKYLVFDFSRYGQTLEQLRKQFPDEVGRVLSETFVIETVEFVDLSVFVVASKDGNSVFVFDFEQQDVEEGFHRVESAVDVITHEEVVGGLGKWGGTGSLPQISKISSRSKNCPWVSPQTVTGARTCTRLGSAIRISLACIIG